MQTGRQECKNSSELVGVCTAGSLLVISLPASAAPRDCFTALRSAMISVEKGQGWL